MQNKYIVCDETGNVSYSSGAEPEPESFTTFGLAEKRAKQLSSLAPGQDILICEVVAVTTTPLGKTETARVPQVKRRIFKQE